MESPRRGRGTAGRDDARVTETMRNLPSNQQMNMAAGVLGALLLGIICLFIVFIYFWDRQADSDHLTRAADAYATSPNKIIHERAKSAPILAKIARGNCPNIHRDNGVCQYVYGNGYNDSWSPFNRNVFLRISSFVEERALLREQINPLLKNICEHETDKTLRNYMSCETGTYFDVEITDN